MKGSCASVPSKVSCALDKGKIVFFLPDVGRVRRMPSRAVADWLRVASRLALRAWRPHASPRG